MKIYDTSHQAASAAAGQTAQTHRTDSTGTNPGIRSTGPAGKSDEVQLSGVGAELAAESAIPERDARLSELTSMFRNGTYQVDANAVSGRLIDDAVLAH